MTLSVTRMASAVATTVAVGSVAVLGPAATASAAPSPTTKVVASASAAVPTSSRNPKVSRSMRGVRPTAYIGKHYRAGHESTRRCIVRKESGGNYRVTSPGGYYRGAYQFNPGLARATANRMGRPKMARKPMNTWSRYHQDRAFWMVWNKGKGRGHWPTARGC